MWQELNREDTTTSFHYLLRAGSNINHYEISWQNQQYSSAFPDMQKYRTHVWGPQDLPICARQCNKAHLASPLALAESWCTVHGRNTSTECGFPGQRTCCWCDSHRRSSALELTSPVLAACLQKSSNAVSKKKKILLFNLNFLLPLWNSSNSSLTQTCKKWLIFKKKFLFFVVFSDEKVKMQRNSYLCIFCFCTSAY